ncbi:MAG: ABC transporter permease [Candidatus Competibacteraceae bacterium]
MHKARYFELVFYKTYADLRAEAARTYISFLWWILDPLINMVVFYFVFKVILNHGTENFVSVLLVGLVFWKWFTNSIQHALNSIPIHLGLIQQIYLPKLLLPLITILTDFIKFMVVFSVLILLLLLIGITPSVAWISLPVLFALQLLLVTGGGCLVAAINPFFPDLRILTEHGLTLLMFLSGVFFDVSVVPEPYRVFFFVNPMAVMIDAFRLVILENRLPNWFALGYVFVFGAIILAVALTILARFDRVYPRLTLA